jgi:hypothetical protein
MAILLIGRLSAGPCEEEPDTITIRGPSDALPGDTVALSTLAGGTDPGGAASYAWAIAEGIGRIVGPADGWTVEVTSGVPGAVAVELTYDDGVCAGAGPLVSAWRIEFGRAEDLMKPGDMNQDGNFGVVQKGRFRVPQGRGCLGGAVSGKKMLFGRGSIGEHKAGFIAGCNPALNHAGTSTSPIPSRS